MKNEPLVVERTFNAPIAKVWTAITNKDEMKKWYFDLEEFKPEAGFEFRFVGGTEEKSFLHICTITEVIKEKKLKYSWRYDGYEGTSYVTFELFPEGDKTRIKLTHEGIESFPADPNFAKENFIGGWKDIIGRSLKEYLER
jgi:uncharacterized protein YndB with AHSA1/START domain